MFDLKGKRALITGSTQGIGYAIARLLYEHGAEVWIHCSSDSAKAKHIAELIGCKRWAVGDLSDEECVKRLFIKTGELDIVVANASVQYRNPWDKITDNEFQVQINVNLRSTLQLMQQYIPPMQRNGWGRFLTVGSVQQYRPNPTMSVYAASKCAISSLVQSVAKQVARDGVTVNNLVPGVILTPRNDAVLQDEEYYKKIVRGIPAGVCGTVDDCAVAALLLCSDESKYITGAELKVDGGMSIN